MTETNDQLKTYINQQLHAGFSPDEVATHLRAANWPEDQIQAAFQTLQNELMPSAAPANHAPAPAGQPAPLPRATTVKRGRIKTGWRLLKQSMTILQNNKGLIRYAVMSAVISFVAVIIMLGIMIPIALASKDPATGDVTVPTDLGFLIAVVFYGVLFFIANYYAAGLTANVLDIFTGQKKPYQTYMAVARSKAGTLLLYSLIESTVGLLLRIIAERVRFIGWLIARILGALWSLGTMFVVPIIVTNEKPSATGAIKQSIGFFKGTWGEGITAKVTVSTAVLMIDFLMTLAIFISGGLLVFGAGTVFGDVGAAIVGITTLIIWLVAVILLSIFSVLANSIINVALFYYAKYRQIPPAFDAELLNSVFITRNKQ